MLIPPPLPVQVTVDAVSQSLNVNRPFRLMWCVELCASFTHGVGRLVSDAEGVVSVKMCVACHSACFGTT